MLKRDTWDDIDLCPGCQITCYVALLEGFPVFTTVKATKGVTLRWGDDADASVRTVPGPEQDDSAISSIVANTAALFTALAFIAF